MSHTQTRKVDLKIDFETIEALKTACKILGYEYIGQGEYNLYNDKIKGYGVKLPNWKYPVIFTQEGIKYDNYEGAWGNSKKLDKLIQRTVTEKIKINARKQGFSVMEKEENDEIKLILEV